MFDKHSFILAEVELPYEEYIHTILLPSWIDKDVTDDPKYLNCNLII